MVGQIKPPTLTKIISLIVLLALFQLESYVHLFYIAVALCTGCLPRQFSQKPCKMHDVVKLAAQALPSIARAALPPQNKRSWAYLGNCGFLRVNLNERR
ncbi:hypothetical protein GGR51DRAFT_519859 [Nemania sp. FL0031]|nr:hypothetical protein GGR51DRAFT_519859 [Nemania sp. FL0031]